MSRNRSRAALRRLLWLVAGLLAAPAIAVAQTTPAAASSSASMDRGSMPGMDMGQMRDMSMPAAAASVPAPAATKAPERHRKLSAKPMHHGATARMGAMPGMEPDAMRKMDKAAVPAASGTSHEPGTMAGMPMGPVQGGSPLPGARSPDYSDGIGYGAMPGMDMRDSMPLDMLRFDQLEAFHGKNGNGQDWELQGWYGGDSNKLWLRSEGERSRGRIQDGDAELLWSHAVAAFWDTQLGLRQDLGEGPARHWAAFGIQGLAPYWFELAATAYLGPSGRTAARLRADYELLFTQRLILQPEFELNAYGRSDPARRLGGGVSDARFGLRLRYEVRRQFAPYLGVVWTRRFGGTAAFARDHHQAIFDRQWVAGVRIWF